MTLFEKSQSILLNISLFSALKANCAEETFLGPLRLKSLKLNYCLSGTIAEFDFLSRNNNNISSVFKKGFILYVYFILFICILFSKIIYNMIIYNMMYDNRRMKEREKNVLILLTILRISTNLME